MNDEAPKPPETNELSPTHEVVTVPIWMESVETPNWIPIMLEQKRIKELA